jgi:hypothetical protein
MISTGQAVCEAKVREPAALVVLSRLETTANRAEKLVSIVLERTNSVTRNEPAQESNKATDPPRSPFPPLFERITELTESINRSLFGIEDVMRRLEL